MTDEPSIKEVIKTNVLALLKHQGGAFSARESSGVTRLKALGFPHGTAQRILDDTTAIGVNVLGELADKLKVEPWHLLVPGLDPAHLPTKGEPATVGRWPFHMLDEQAYFSLPEADRNFMLGAFNNEIRNAAARMRERLSAPGLGGGKPQSGQPRPSAGRSSMTAPALILPFARPQFHPDGGGCNPRDSTPPSGGAYVQCIQGSWGLF